MERVSGFKIPVVISVAAIVWAFLISPLLARVGLRMKPDDRYLFHAVTDLIVVLATGWLLYVRIRRYGREVRKSRDEYRRLFDELPVPMFIFDSRTFRFLAVNNAAISVYGYSREELTNIPELVTKCL